LSAAVEFRDVSFRIGQRTILRDLRLTIEEGETLVLLGRSGSGKTTILKLINALLFPTSGTVLVSGRPTPEWDAVKLKRSIGYAIQEVGLFPHFSVHDNIGLVPRLENWPPSRIDARVTELLRMLELPADDFARRYPRELSGGQRQRVGIARALAADPKLLLLDEPFGALDPVTRTEVQRQFRELVARLKKTTVFVTHDVREALLLATRIVLLESGIVDFVGTPAEFREARSKEAEAFLQCLAV
jgi:osmoprotectant transport system ATP-binding protein